MIRALSVLLACSGACAASEPSRSATTSAEPDAIVVLGHRPPRDAHGLEYETRARVERGVALFEAGRASRLLFSGGRSTPEVVEADEMARYAEQRGVPAAAILREGQSRDTIENARMSVALLREALKLARPPRVLLVTSDYHIERASRLFRCAGAEVVPVPVALALQPHERRKRVWGERLVAFVYAFIDECGRTRRGR